MNAGQMSGQVTDGAGDGGGGHPALVFPVTCLQTAGTPAWDRLCVMRRETRACLSCLRACLEHTKSILTYFSFYLFFGYRKLTPRLYIFSTLPVFMASFVTSPAIPLKTR